MAKRKEKNAKRQVMVDEQLCTKLKIENMNLIKNNNRGVV